MTVDDPTVFGAGQHDSGADGIIPPAGATLLAYRQYVYTTHPGAAAAFIDDMEIVPSTSGGTAYPGVKGTVKDNNGNPVAGALVFLKRAPKAQMHPQSTGGWAL